MKMILALAFALSTVSSVFAAVGAPIAGLNKTITIKLNDDTFKGGFIKADKNVAYYYVASSFEELKIRVSRESTTDEYDVALILDAATLIEFQAPGKKSAATYDATSIALKEHKALSTDIGLDYWYSFKTTGKREATKVSLVSNLESSNSIVAPVQITGSMNFSPCDGCEHSDQLIVQGKGLAVNVINMKFGKYYEEDCSGTLHRLFSRMLEEDQVNDDYVPGLSVPFTYAGTINSDSGDYRDSIDDFWVGEKGIISVGYTTKLPLDRFLDALPYQVAATLKVDVKEIAKDVLENGNFTKLSKDVLTFVYKNVEIKTDLKTAKSTAKKI